MARETEIRVLEVETATRRIDYRSPMKFGGRVVRDVTVADAQVLVETRSGKRAIGRGSMTMGNAWAWPAATLSSDQTLTEMVSLFASAGDALAADSEFGDPLQLGKWLEGRASSLAKQGAAARSEAMPVLAERVAISPLDAAVHDAFGRVHGGSSFARLGAEWIGEDLGAYLGPEFAGEYLDRWISPTPVAQLPLYHLVGALDPLTSGDVTERIGDGLPETLGEWIEWNGLDHLKIKLAGDDLAWDVARVLAVDAVAASIWDQRPGNVGSYSLDFNERCPNAEYVVEFLARIRETRPRGFDRIQYLEQPTHRDLSGAGAISMHAAAQIKPVVIDESLIDLESLESARRLGYSGCALKACKGQTDSLLMAAAARKFGLFLCVQDLTCIGASFLHSASLAAHVPTVAAIEGNGRQYCPQGNAGWERLYPGMFQVTSGRVATGELAGAGLGFEWIGVGT